MNKHEYNTPQTVRKSAPRLAFTAMSLFLAAGSAARANNGMLEKVLDRTTEARNKAAAAKESAGEIRDRIRDAADNLTGNVKDAITEAVQEVSGKITAELEGKAVFESEYCEEFRSELIATLEDLNMLENRVRSMINPCQPEKSGGPTPLISLLEQAPCGVLYPLYKVEIDFCPFVQLTETVDAVAVVHDITGGLTEAGEATLDFVDTVHDAAQDAQVFAARLQASRVYLENHDALADASKKLRSMARLLDSLGGRLKAKGEKNNAEASVGIHGYAHIKYASNHKKQLGEKIQSLAGMLNKIADFVDKKTDNAQELSTANVYLTNQETIIANQEAILEAMSQE